MRTTATTAELRLERLLELQSLLAKVASEIGAALELQPVLTTVLSAMRSLVAFKGGSICLVDDGHVYIAAADPPVSREVAMLRLPVGTGLAGRCISTGEPIYSENLDTDERVDPEVRRLGSNKTMKSYLAVPLVCVGQVIGLLQVDSSEIDAFDQDDLRVFQGLAAQVAGAIESARQRDKEAELEVLKDDFIARISHELRTPLTITTGFIETLLIHEDDLDADRRRQILERVDVANRRLQGLIDDLLTLSTFEAGVTRAVLLEYPLEGLLLQVKENAAEPTLVDVDCDPDSFVVTDEKLFRHALGLLVDNALKYGGSASIRGKVAQQEVEIEVRDWGPGIPEGLREIAFDRFTRGDHTEPGMGLGLPIVRKVFEAIGGEVRLACPDDGGTVFTINLPVTVDRKERNGSARLRTKATAMTMEADQIVSA